MNTMVEPKLISGNSNQILSKAIAKRMSLLRGSPVKLINARIERFNDQEIFIEVYDNVRGEDMFIIQSTSNPANDNLMELLIMADALRRHISPEVGERSLAPFRYGRQPELLRLLEEAGFAEVCSRTITVERVVSDPERNIELEILGNPVGPAVVAQGPEAMRTIVAEIPDACEARRRGPDLVIPQETFLISARAD